MVVFLDLEDEISDPHADTHYGRGPHLGGEAASRDSITAHSSKRKEGKLAERPNPNVNSFSAILSCYP